MTRARFAAFLRLPHQRRCRPPKSRNEVRVVTPANPAAPTRAELDAAVTIDGLTVRAWS